MNEKSTFIDRLEKEHGYRASYIRSKVSVNIPSQIKALRRRRNMSQESLAQEAGMKQSRISAIERPSLTGFTVETLVRLAAAFKVGLLVKFVPFSDMLRWENRYSQDLFDVIEINEDVEFINPDDLIKMTRDIEPSGIYKEGVLTGQDINPSSAKAILYDFQAHARSKANVTANLKPVVAEVNLYNTAVAGGA